MNLIREEKEIFLRKRAVRSKGEKIEKKIL